MSRDWGAWHRAYDDPNSALSRRQDEVVALLCRAVDAAAPGPIRLISLCCGDARDVARVLVDHPRREDVVGCVIELDAELATAAETNLEQVSGLVVRCGDAGDPELFVDMIPADILLLVGIFGNISDADVERVVSAVPSICAEDSTVIWTRHRRDPDLTPAIAAWFDAAGCEASTFTSPGLGSYAVGSQRCRRPASPLPLPPRLFSFRDDLW